MFLGGGVRYYRIGTLGRYLLMVKVRALEILKL